MSNVLDDSRLEWLKNEDIKPYVFVRKENRIPEPGKLSDLDWFKGKKPEYINPLLMDEVEFGNQILELEARAFGPANMAMPRWVFYDCAITPGFVAGFAIRRKALPKHLESKFEFLRDHEWVPLSLFIIIPTMSEDGEWVAHNLCTVNSLLPKEDRFYGMGFLSKAFGLWYANVNICCGFTQWGNPAIRLHSYYGPFEILTAYTPIHSYPRTLTYRVNLETKQWSNFFTKKPIEDFHNRFKKMDFSVDPKDAASLKKLQRKLENSEGPFYLDSHEVLTNKLDAPLSLYRPNN